MPHLPDKPHPFRDRMEDEENRPRRLFGRKRNEEQDLFRKSGKIRPLAAPSDPEEIIRDMKGTPKWNEIIRRRRVNKVPMG